MVPAKRLLLHMQRENFWSLWLLTTVSFSWNPVMKQWVIYTVLEFSLLTNSVSNELLVADNKIQVITG